MNKVKLNHEMKLEGGEPTIVFSFTINKPPERKKIVEDSMREEKTKKEEEYYSIDLFCIIFSLQALSGTKMRRKMYPNNICFKNENRK